MYKPISFFIGFRYLWNSHLPKFKKFITILSILGISISTSSLIIILSIINGSENNFKKNILTFIPHLIITNQNKYINKNKFPKDILQSQEIEKFSTFISKEVIVKNKNNVAMAEIIDFDPNNYDNVKKYSTNDVLDKLKSGENNIIIGKELAKKIHVNIGDKITLIVLSDKKNYFSGKIFNECVFKIINTFSTQNEVDYYQILMNKEDVLKFLNYSKNYVTGWRFWLKNPLDFNINELKKISTQLVVLDWKLQKGEFFKAIKIEKYMMLFLFFLILFISILNIFITLTVYIIEKKNAIAILKTQGLLNWKIMLIFIIIGSSTAIIGSFFGTAISIALIIQNDLLKFFIKIFFHEINITIIIKPFQIILINLISILLTIITIVYPTLKAIRLQPVKLLSNE